MTIPHCTNINQDQHTLLWRVYAKFFRLLFAGNSFNSKVNICITSGIVSLNLNFGALCKNLSYLVLIALHYFFILRKKSEMGFISILK